MIDKEDNLIKVALEESNNLFLKILDDYPELDDSDPRRGAFLLSLMTNCVAALHAMGWSEKNLVNEVFDWCQISREMFDEDEE